MIHNPLFQRILIVRTDRIGDVVLTTPAVKALRNRFPHAHLAILVTPATCPLVRDHPCLDEVIVDDRKNIHRGWMGFARLLYSIRRRRFDLAIVFHTKKRTNLMCFLAGIRNRLGYRDNKWGFLLNHPLQDQREDGTRHEAQYCLDLLKPLGIENSSLDALVTVEPGAMKWVKQLLILEKVRPPVALVHLGASDSSRQWPPEYFAEVSQYLTQRRRCQIIIIGTADQKPLVSRIQKYANIPLLDMTGRTSLAQLVALIKQSDLVVSSDSGPVHLAYAVHTPVVCVFTRNQPGINPERWKPLGVRSCYVAPPEDTYFFPQGRILNPTDSKLVDPQTVIAAVDGVFKLC